MQRDFFQSKALTRDYASACEVELPVLDTMVARRSWRKYQDWEVGPDFKEEFESFIAYSSKRRNCSTSDLLLITDRSRLGDLFKTAYSGFVGKANPWLPKSKASGMLVLAIDKDSRNDERPLGYVYPTLVGQDAVLWLTEKGLGSVWLAAINGPALAKEVGLPSNKWIYAAIIFGKTGKKPKGLNYDNLSYQVVSKRRKVLSKISSLNQFKTPFQINDREPKKLDCPKYKITDALSMLDHWEETPAGDPVRLIELELLMEGARIAPSACNKQPWQFVAINDEKKLNEISEIMGVEEELKGAIACLGEANSIYEIGMERPFWLIDVPVAMANMSLMAAAIGRGVKVYLEIPEKKINNYLNLKGNWRTAGIIGLK